MPNVGYLTVDLAQHVNDLGFCAEIIDDDKQVLARYYYGSINPAYTDNDEYGREQGFTCDYCKKQFCSTAWMLIAYHDYISVYACSKDCLDSGIVKKLGIMCDCCGETTLRATAQHAIVHNIDVTVCSDACLARLYHIWQPDTMRHKVARLLRKAARSLYPL